MSPKLFFNIVSMQARRQMSYRADFWLLTIFGFLAQVGVVYFLWDAIFRESGSASIGGFTFQEMILYYVLAILIGKFTNVAGVEGSFSIDIYDGSLSRYIVYPTNYLLFKYAQKCGETFPAFIQFVLLSVIAVYVVGIPDTFNVTPLSALLFAGSVLMAFTMFVFVTCPIEGAAFWADNVWSLNVITRFTVQLLGGGMLPLTIFPDAVREGLMWTPFPYIVFEPVRVLLGEVSPAAWLQGMSICGAWMAFVLLVTSLVWNRGYESYTGVGM
jgi:ABC-2 type transport system permease protein